MKDETHFVEQPFLFRQGVPARFQTGELFRDNYDRSVTTENIHTLNCLRSDLNVMAEVMRDNHFQKNPTSIQHNPDLVQTQTLQRASISHNEGDPNANDERDKKKDGDARRCQDVL